MLAVLSNYQGGLESRRAEFRQILLGCNVETLDWPESCTFNATKMDDQSREQQMNSLRGLGYIGEGVELAEQSTEGGFDFWSVGDTVLVGNLHGEIVYYLYVGDTESANQVMQILNQNRPDLAGEVVYAVRNKFRGIREQLPEGYFDLRSFRVFLRNNETANPVSDDA